MFSEIPGRLYGIWEGKDRYVFFEKDENERDQIVIILKTYYGWYLDRVVEDASYGEKAKRDRNAATTKEPVFVISEANQILDYNDAYEMTLTYDKRDISYVPFCIIDGVMYLDFYLRSEKNPEFWLGNVVSEGIKVSNQTFKNDFYSWYISKDGEVCYKVRYWQSNMDYDSSLEAIIKSKYLDDEVKITKHILSANNVYTCVPGRRVYVRNLDKRAEAFDGKTMVYNEENNVCAASEPYLKQLVDKKTFDDMMEIVRYQNSQRKPDPPPLFPDMEVDYHWDLIDMLEKDNKIIQEVRERQKAFGTRGKDIGK